MAAELAWDMGSNAIEIFSKNKTTTTADRPAASHISRLFSKEKN